MPVMLKMARALRVMSFRNHEDSLNGSYVSHERHIVIGGCGRSGTTLLRVILDSHPNLCCGPESKVFVRERLHVDRILRNFKFEPAAIVALIKASQSRTEFIDRFARLCCTMTEKSRWAEKTPRNIESIGYVLDRFPNALFVNMLRDGRDTACSLQVHPRYRVRNGKVVPTNKRKPMMYAATRWRDCIAEARPYLSHPRFRTVRYEDLVADPRGTIGRLLHFLGEKWDNAVLAHTDAKSQFRDATTFAQTPEANKPIEKSALGRWQRDMAPADKRIFKKIAGQALIECDYAADLDW